MRVVLDTNLIISATLIRGGNEDRILRAWHRGEFDLVLSPAVIEEIGRVLLYEKIRRARWMTEREIAELLGALAASSIIVTGRTAVKVSRDPDDDKLVAAAIQGEARFLVTGDRDLLDIGNYRDVEIITPAHFLRAIRIA